MYDKFIIDFYKKHNIYNEKMFEYLYEHTDIVDYYDEFENIHIGFGVNNNNFFRIAKSLRICIPIAMDAKTSIYDIHEIAHGIVAYRHLYRRYVEDITVESLPFLYEKLYINESNDINTINYGLYLDSLVDEKSPEKYKFALWARDYLLDEYDKDINHMEKLSKQLVKKYKKENK